MYHYCMSINKDLLVIGHLNIQSLVPKFNELQLYTNQHNFDILAISETWLNSNINSNSLAIDNYMLIRKDRNTGQRGGGVLLYIHSKLRYQVIDVSNDIEQLFVEIVFKGLCFVIGVSYKPPDLSYKYYIDALESSLTYVMSYSTNVICVGDVNVDFLKENSPAVKYFNSMLSSLEMNQLITEATHITPNSESLIDVILCNNDSFIDSTTILESNFSFHECISCAINCEKPKIETRLITIRDCKNFDEQILFNDLLESGLQKIFHIQDIDDKVQAFTEILLNLYNKHFPPKVIRITKKNAPWITNEVKDLMKKRDKARARHKKIRTQENWEEYKRLRNLTNHVITREKSAYFQFMTVNASKKELWRELKLLDISKKSQADITQKFKDANVINNFFLDNIPSNVVKNSINDYYENSSICENEFRFQLVDETTVLKALKKIKNSAPGFDGLSIAFIKICCPHILLYLVHIFNSIIVTTKFPTSWKHARITPIPKIKNPQEISDLRPISILIGLSKILEKLLAEQLSQFLDENHILPQIQSGFRTGHSSTTALLHITDDIFQAVDKSECTALIMLDFSKAFDTVRHDTLLAILKSSGVCIDSLQLFRSYLTDRKQSVKLGDNLSVPRNVLSGVPQGSVLGPLLFSLYTSQFDKFIRYCKMHMYADDIQLYYNFSIGELNNAAVTLNTDLDNIADIANQHSLMLNAKKSVALVFGNKCNKSIAKSNLQINIKNDVIKISDNAKSLGLILDDSLRFREHVMRSIQRAYGALRLLYPHRSYIPTATKKVLCETLVLSQFNYCSPIYGFCLDQETHSRVQRVQNSCIRFIYGIRKYEHVSHKLKELRWLPMKERFSFISLCLFHKIILYKCPPYLYDKLNYRTDIHNVNIRNRNKLSCPAHRTSIFERSFQFNIYKLYNAIPDEIKKCSMYKFKKEIKPNC